MAKEHKITEWDAGQSLIKSADTLAECEDELRVVGYDGCAELLRKCRLAIGVVFNEHHAYKSHSFGLPGTEDPNDLPSMKE